ncbi:hypothetical protein [Dongia deserti]|uniref:hypothetical protein n=1 Tax=Dongia deserti TaxID=2268030 RepID=UPI000E6469AB|nr:hypothetical protein [Dongia deserti]
MAGQARHDPRQATLFDSDSSTVASGSLNFDREWRAALNQAIEECGFGRANIATEMERLLGNDPDYPVSVALLNAWTAASKTDYRFPLIYLPAFVRATGAMWLLDRLASKCGRAIVDDELATIAQLRDERSRIDSLVKDLERQRRTRHRGSGRP